MEEVRRSAARRVAFVAMMGALSSALFALSATVLNWGQVALDLSSMGVLIASFYGGPLAGLSVGMLAGILPGVYFGSTSGLLPLFLPGLVAGKSLTGLSVGALSRALNVLGRRRKAAAALTATLVGYVPECLFTVAFFLAVIPFFAPQAAWLTNVMVPVVVKAWIEMAIMGFYMAALVGNQGFTLLVARLWPTPEAFVALKR